MNLHDEWNRWNSRIGRNKRCSSAPIISFLEGRSLRNALIFLRRTPEKGSNSNVRPCGIRKYSKVHALPSSRWPNGTRCLSREKTATLHIKDVVVALLSKRARVGRWPTAAGAPASV